MTVFSTMSDIAASSKLELQFRRLDLIIGEKSRPLRAHSFILLNGDIEKKKAGLGIREFVGKVSWSRYAQNVVGAMSVRD